MSDLILLQILNHLLKYHRRGTLEFLEDKAISKNSGIPLQEVQDKLKILQQQGLANIFGTFGPSIAAQLTPEGIDFAEKLAQQIEMEKRKKPNGFKRS